MWGPLGENAARSFEKCGAFRGWLLAGAKGQGLIGGELGTGHVPCENT
jgi:hypothetical protein